MESEPVSAVLDTNVIVSAALHPGTVPDSAVSAGLDGRYLICYSDGIIKEYREVLARKKFKLTKKKIDTFIADIKKAGKLFTPKEKISISPDPDDDKFLECAKEANAHFLVTGNKRHYPESIGRTKIVTPREFVTILISAAIILP